MRVKRYCFDIDNTVCVTKGKNYKTAKPKKNIIKIINKLYQQGNVIIFFTSRYMGRNSESVTKAKKMGYKSTYAQLLSWGLKFHKLIMGKPSYDVIIDDKSICYNKSWYKKFNQ